MTYSFSYMDECGDIQTLHFDNELEALRCWNAYSNMDDILMIGGIVKSK